MSATPLDAWVAAHPYLRELARFMARVEEAASRIETLRAAIPDWNAYVEDFRAGFPLLRSVDAAIDLEPAGRMAMALVEKLSSSPPADGWADLPRLDAELRRDPEAPRRVAGSLLGDEAFETPSPGLLRYLGWTAAARYLRPVVAAFAGWRDDEKWLRNYCPTCGSLPAMAQLVGMDPGRKRTLICGCCATGWQFGRTKCPFCENDTQRQAVVAVEGEGGLRIDHCESCRGYLKTYDGQGNEAILLADWTSLHLDVVAQDRGFQRLAASLYELPS